MYLSVSREYKVVPWIPMGLQNRVGYRGIEVPITIDRSDNSLA